MTFTTWLPCYRRSATTQRAKNILNMVPQIEENTKKVQKIFHKDKQQRIIDAGDLSYVDNIYTRPYSMTSSIFETFCETQISSNSHYLPDLTKLKKEFFAKECDGIHVQKSDANSNINNFSIDLTCKEVMPIEESQEPTHFDNNSKTENLQNYKTHDLDTTCDYDSDDSVRDKDYNPPESETSSDESIGEVKQKKIGNYV